MSSMDLKEIFDAITPQNIKDNLLVKHAMEIFIENIESLSPISININNIWDNVSNKTVLGKYSQEDDLIIKSKNRLRNSILKTYLSILYDTLEKAQSDQALYDKFERDGITDSPLNGDIIDIITEEHFFSNKSFNEIVGTKKGLQYAYNLAQYVETTAYRNDLVLEDIQPFVYKVDGSIYHETYETIVKPLAHPLGFCYEYQQLMDIILYDDYDFKNIYLFTAIEVRQIDGYFYVYTEDLNDKNIRTTFLTKRINPLTNNLFTLNEYNIYVKVYTNKHPMDYNNFSETDGYNILRFLDGTCIIDYTDDNTIVYCLYSEFLKNNYNPVFIREFSKHASLYLEFTTSIKFGYYDEIRMDYDIILSDDVKIIKKNDDIKFDMDVKSGRYLICENHFYLCSNDGFYIYGYDNNMFYPLNVEEDPTNSECKARNTKGYVFVPFEGIYTDVHITDMSSMFRGTSFNQDISNWNVSNVTDMSSMFRGTSFNQDISNWNVSNVTDMSSMFIGTSFNQDISNWNVSKITDMSSMFYESSFNQDISNWNVSKITDMSSMFYESSFNQDISNWNVSKVTDMSSMFRGTSFNQDISNWNVSKITDMSYMFNESKFNQDISSWDVSNVTDMSSMFKYSQFNQDISNWEVYRLINMMGMFESSIFNQNILNWDIYSVINMAYMFRSSQFNQDISYWDVSNVTDMSYMFEYSIFDQDISNWNVSNVADMAHMFSRSLFNQDIPNWNVRSVWNMYIMFEYSIFNQDISNWDVSNVNDMGSMFNESKFNQDISNWNVLLITTEPAHFSSNCPLLLEYKPVWGTDGSLNS